MKFLLIFTIFFNCGVLSRYISKRSLLGGEHHHHHPENHHHHPAPSDVYLPPAAETTKETEEITTIVPIAAVKPAETYLVEDAAAFDGEATEVSIPDVVDLKKDEDSSVEPEAPTIKPVEIYSVETEATLVELEAPEDETEAPAVETEAPVIGTEAPEAPAIKPAETYIVETEATIATTEATAAETVASVVGTEGTVAETEAPAVKIVETYLVEEEPVAAVEALKPTETYIVEEEITTDGEPATEPTGEVAYDTDTMIELNAGSDISVGENTEAEGSSVKNSPQEEEVKALETVDNSVEPAIVKPKHVEGYWIEVSGDRDVLVKYHV